MFLTKSHRRVPQDLLTDAHFTDKLRQNLELPKKSMAKEIIGNRSLQRLLESTLTYQQKDGPQAHDSLQGHLFNQLNLHYSKVPSSKLQRKNRFE